MVQVLGFVVAISIRTALVQRRSEQLFARWDKDNCPRLCNRTGLGVVLRRPFQTSQLEWDGKQLESYLGHKHRNSRPNYSSCCIHDLHSIPLGFGRIACSRLHGSLCNIRHKERDLGCIGNLWIKANCTDNLPVIFVPVGVFRYQTCPLQSTTFIKRQWTTTKILHLLLPAVSLLTLVPGTVKYIICFSLQLSKTISVHMYNCSGQYRMSTECTGQHTVSICKRCHFGNI